MSACYPVCLNLSRRKCAVVGGGQVALRKTLSLLECGAQVKLISPELCAGIGELAAQGRIAVLQRHFQSGDLAGVFLVIAATSDDEANRTIAREAHKAGALVNVVDDAENSDFTVPSYLRRGDITIAVSTSGASPALARRIRADLENSFGGEYAGLLKMVNEVRSDLKLKGLRPGADDWQKALRTDELLELVRNGEMEQAKSRLLTELTAAGRPS